MKLPRPELWFFLFLSGLLAFNWPFLAIAYQKAWYYLTALWVIFIGLIGISTLSLKDR